MAAFVYHAEVLSFGSWILGHEGSLNLTIEDQGPKT
jgi:hypothetical protein